MTRIGFGRVNIPHYGHKEYISKCDIFVLSSGKAKNKLPDYTRYESLVRMYPELKEKIVIGNIKEFFLKYPDAEVLCTPDNISFPKAFNLKVKILEKVGDISSTKIREFIDNKDYRSLYKIYKKVSLIKEAIKLRELELLCQEHSAKCP